MITLPYETTDLLISSLPVNGSGGPLATVAQVTFGPVPAGSFVSVMGRTHGDPRQSQGQEECSWVTGISVYDSQGNAVAHPNNYGGCDLEHARKFKRSDPGWFVTDQDYDQLTVQYRMRAINLTPGGQLHLSWVYLGAAILGQVYVPPAPEPPTPSQDLLFKGEWQSTADGLAHTSPIIQLGAADPDRKLILPVGIRHNVAGTVITSVEVEGASGWEPAAKLFGRVNPAEGSDVTEIWGLVFPDGTETRVRITCNAAAMRAAGAIYTKGGALEPSMTASDLTLSGVNLSASLTMGGSVLGVVTGRHSYQWQPGPSDFDMNVEAGWGMSCAALDFPGPTASISIDQPDTLGAPVFLMAGWSS